MESFPTALVARAALLVVIVLAARLDEAGAIAIAAVLVGKGLDPGIAVALLALGPLTRSAVARAMARRLAVARAILAVEVVVAVGAARLLSGSGALAGSQAAARQALHDVRNAFAAQVAAAPFGVVAATILVAVALATLWSEGVRGWFAPLRHGPRTV